MDAESRYTESMQGCGVYVAKLAAGSATSHPRQLWKKRFLWKLEIIGDKMDPGNSISFVCPHFFVGLKKIDQ